MRLHTGHEVPAQIEQTVRGWQRDDQPITPGWLESLPENFRDLCEKWDIHTNHIVPDTWVTLVALGDSAQLGPVVLKTSALADECLSESTALQSVREPMSRGFMIWMLSAARWFWSESFLARNFVMRS